MVLVFHAQRLRTLGQFSSPDPWNGNRPTAFTIEEYVMMPSGATQATDSSQYAHRVGLRSESDGSQRMIPESLVELWRRGQVPAERIPILAQAIEPRVLKEDFNLILHQSARNTIVLPLLGVFAVTAGVAAFVPMDGERLSIPVALAVSAGFTLLVGAIFWITRQSGRNRRREQMAWLLSVNSSAGASAPPEGRAKGRVKMFAKLYAVLLLVCLLFGGVAALWIWKGGSLTASSTAASSPKVSSATGDIEMPIEIMANQVSAGLAMMLTVPVTGEQVTVTIPPSVTEGSRLRLRGKGAPAANTGAPGDLYLKIHVRY